MKNSKEVFMYKIIYVFNLMQILIETFNELKAKIRSKSHSELEKIC